MPRKSFEEWMQLVNRYIGRRTCGMGSEDLPDWEYWSAWDAGMPPSEAAREAIRAARDY